MRGGRRVKVSPTDDPKQWAFAVLTRISDNHNSAALEFDAMPGFLRTSLLLGAEIGKDTSSDRVTMLLIRESDRGPWTDIVTGLKYEITE
jgi:hypothetical protein